MPITNATYQQALKDAHKLGIVTTTQSLAQPLPPPNQNAAPIYKTLNAALKSQPITKSEWNDQLSFVSDSPMPKQIAQARNLLAQHAQILKLTHRAAAMPSCVFTRKWDYVAGNNYPELSAIHQGARILSTESILMACDG